MTDTIEPCGKCDQPHVTRFGHQACRGHKTPARGGHACKRPPLQGQRVCGAHGGNAPAARRAGARRRTEQAALIAMHKFGGPIDTTATEALLDTVKWTAGYVGWLRGIVGHLRADEIGWGLSEDKTGGQDWGTTEKAAVNVHLAILGEWTDRLVKVCAEALKAGIEERRVRLAEQQGELVADVIKAILADLNLSPEQQAQVGNVVPLHIRRLAG